MAEPYSYILFKDASTYYAKNGLTGAIDYSGTNASQVIDNALAVGGTIFLRKGEYYLSGELKINVAGTSIIGEGSGTKLIIISGATKSAIVVTKPNFRISNLVINSTITKTAGFGIAIDGATTFVYTGNDRIGVVNEIKDVIIENQWIGLSIDQNSMMVYLENIDIRNSYDKGIVLDNASFIYLNKITTFNWIRTYSIGLHLIKAFSIYASECEFLNAHDYGVLSNPPTGVTNQWLRFVNCAVETNETDTGGDGWVFTNNQGGNNEGVYLYDFWATSTRNGIILDGVNDAQIVGAQAHGNARHGLWIQDTNTKQVEIKGGHFSVNSRAANNTYDGIHVDAGISHFSIIGTIIYGNNIYGETGTVFQRYAIRVDVGASDWYIITENLVRYNGSYGVSDGGTGTHKLVTDNVQ
jgi:hypothetical protein